MPLPVTSEHKTELTLIMLSAEFRFGSGIGAKTTNWGDLPKPFLEAFRIWLSMSANSGECGSSCDEGSAGVGFGAGVVVVVVVVVEVVELAVVLAVVATELVVGMLRGSPEERELPTSNFQNAISRPDNSLVQAEDAPNEHHHVQVTSSNRSASKPIKALAI